MRSSGPTNFSSSAHDVKSTQAPAVAAGPCRAIHDASACCGRSRGLLPLAFAVQKPEQPLESGADDCARR